MPLAPNFLERLMFITLNQGPGPALDMWGGPAFHIVLAAIRLNLFETLNTESLTAEELARGLNTDARATQVLLDALASLKYVSRHGAQYSNTAMSRKWLLSTGAINFSAYYQFWGAMMEHFMPRIEDSLRAGAPPVNLYAWLETQPEVSRYFQEGMIAITRYVKDDIIKALNLSLDSARLLDIGGGHAMYSIALCQKYPRLSAVVFDSPQALTVGREGVSTAKLDGRITFREGDFLNDDLGTGYDVALLFNIVHGFSAEANIDLLRKIKQGLNPGGQVVILEQLAEASPLPLLKAAVQILSISFFHLLGGQVYDYDEIRGWLIEAGFGQVRRKTIPKGGSALIFGSVTPG